jgi:hypothetical protein
MDHDFQRVADLELLGLDRERELTERENPLGLPADVDEQLVLILSDDDAGENLTLVEDLQALFVETLLERELVFFFVDRRRRRDGGGNGVCDFLCDILFLAAAAPPGPALTDNRSHDAASATQTRFVEATVNSELMLKLAFPTLGIDVIVHARPARRDGSLEDVSDRAVQPAPRRFADRVGRAARFDPRFPQRFASVDVPDPRNAGLIQEERLDRRATPRQHTQERLAGKALGKGLDPAVRVPGLVFSEETHPSKGPNVGEAQTDAVFEPDEDASVR